MSTPAQYDIVSMLVVDNLTESNITSCSTVLNNSSQLSRVSRSNMSERRVIGVPEEHKAFLAAWDIFPLRFHISLIFHWWHHLNCKLCDKFPAGWNIWLLGGSRQQHICQEFPENLGIEHDSKHLLSSSPGPEWVSCSLGLLWQVPHKSLQSSQKFPTRSFAWRFNVCDKQVNIEQANK